MSKQNKPLKLDLGCGNNITEGFDGVDISKDTGAKYIFDLFDPKATWPFKDASVDEIVSNHTVEHIPHGNGSDDPFFHFFDEIHRILVPAEFDKENPNIPVKGFARIVCPYYSSVRAWQDPTHMRAISEASFLYLNKEWRTNNKLNHYPVKCDFDFFYNYALDPNIVQRNDEYRGNAIRTQINAVTDIVVTLVKRELKDEKTTH